MANREGGPGLSLSLDEQTTAEEDEAARQKELRRQAETRELRELEQEKARRAANG